MPMARGLNGHDKPQLPETHYLDNRIFTDESIFQEEQERIFAKVWQFSCHESEVEKAGDFRCVRIAGKSVLLVRGDDGIVRGFYNICRHRSAEVVREDSPVHEHFEKVVADCDRQLSRRNLFGHWFSLEQ
jgi:nitrite reductase/ring-hydroxylating ferredoxin subunit